MPLKLLLQILSSSSSLKSSTFPFSSCSSGGNSPFFINRSKCSFKILSIPLGKEGKIESGRLMFLLKLSQKHLGQSLRRARDDGESLYGILVFYLMIILFRSSGRD